LAGDRRTARITPRMLLAHTSGLPNWRRFNDDGKLDLQGEPGARFMYSGEGIVLLQRTIERITGSSATDLVRDRVFSPLHMTHTSLVWQPDFAGLAAVGYHQDGTPAGHEHRTEPDAAGSMNTTIRDFAAFVRAVARGEIPGRRARDAMLSPQVRIRSAHQFPTRAPETTEANDAIRLSYGLGWGLLWSTYGKAYFKEGHDDGWQNYTITFDDAHVAIVIMTNSDNGESTFKELLATLVGDTFTPSDWERYVPYDAPR
jgi:CubicO group peptidase (beta-lactamase class C family)